MVYMKQKEAYNWQKVEIKWSLADARDKQDYHPTEIEKKWQDVWRKKKLFSPDLNSAKNPFYNLMMFPYPSAEGLHVGNMYAFTGSDIYGRYMRMKGYDVFEPIGLDGFGIHSENYAIRVGRHPKKQAEISEKNFYRQLGQIGNAYDWSRKLETYDPNYYKWTQWIFLKLFKAGLAYRKKSAVNFCPKDKTVLADEQVIVKSKVKSSPRFARLDSESERAGEAGQKSKVGHTIAVCERCGTEVEKKELEQWFFKITKYADRLLGNLEKLDWSEKVKIAQRNWIGKKDGTRIKFEIARGPVSSFPPASAPPPFLNEIKSSKRTSESQKGGVRAVGNPSRTATPHNLYIEVFTTRPDTLYGVTFLVLAPEHGLVSGILKSKVKSQKSKVEEIKNYVQEAKSKSELDRIAEGREKTGVFSGLYAINPVNGERIPIWIADYVILGYGTGAIMAVPAHDVRDFEFAKKYKLPIKQVITANRGSTPKAQSSTIGVEPLKQAYVGDGVIVNSGEWDGWRVPQELSKVIDWLEKKGIGKREVTYHLRDWLISRQRYWGPPIPMVFCQKCAQDGKSWFNNSEHSENSENQKIRILRKLGESEDQRIGISAKSDNLTHRLTDLPTRRKTESSEFSEMRGWFPVDEKDLPVLLPEVSDWRPKGEGKSPLANIESFVNTKCPQCGAKAKRETDVSDTFLDSAWYFLRYPSVEKKDVVWDRQRTLDWLPVDMYIGGAEHSVLHLLYSRFLTMVFHDLGLVEFEEPFTKFRAHGLLILRGAKMSKSRGNIVNPDDYIAKYGADTLRCYLMFCGRFEQGGDFIDSGIAGVHRFLKRVWRMVSAWSENSENSESQKIGTLGKLSDSEDQRVRISGKSDNLKHRFTDSPTHRQTESSEYSDYLMHKTIKKVTEDIESLSYNTAIAALMEWLNFLEEKVSRSVENHARGPVTTFLPASARSDQKTDVNEKDQADLRAVGNPSSRATPRDFRFIRQDSKTQHSLVLSEVEGSLITREELETLLLLLAPFAPHMSEELWQRLRAAKITTDDQRISADKNQWKSINMEPWPKYDEKLAKAAKIELVIQVNGKVRDKVSIDAGISEDEAKKVALTSEKIQKYVSGKRNRMIYVAGKLINFVVDSS